MIKSRLTKVGLVSGGRDVLVYTTISGAVGALIPFASMDDVEFMTTLEMVGVFIFSTHAFVAYE